MVEVNRLNDVLALVGQSFSDLDRRARKREQDPGPADRRDRFVAAMVEEPETTPEGGL
jgi:hypothetical protein